MKKRFHCEHCGMTTSAKEGDPCPKCGSKMEEVE